MMSVTSRNLHMNLVLLLICFVVMATQACMIDSIADAGAAEPVIFQRVFVEDVELSDMTRSEAEEALYQYVDKVVLQPLVLTSGDEAWQLDPNDIGLHVFVPEIVERALAVGRAGSWLDRLRFRRASPDKVVSIPLTMSVDEDLFKDFVFDLMAEIHIPAEDAVFIINEDDTVTVKPSRIGRHLDPRDLGNRIRETLPRRYDRTLVLNVQPIMPSLTTSQANAMGIKECIGKFSTSFDPGNTSRVHNIREAANAIDGTILGPGETFSFNKTVGPRSAETGYLDAPVMVEDDLVPGIGGGICQVSSTLYNAVLLANLRVVARVNHSMAPAYVPAGRDATVAYDYIDFRFRNDGSSHVLIKFFLNKNTITSKVYGYMPSGQKISIITSIEERIPPGVIKKEDASLAPGDEVVEDSGAWGYVVTVYRVVEQDGTEQSRELISKDRYRPRSKRVRVGIALSEST
ncbi:MAG TPA: VanW family protein [Bacillota bacterium]|nr:VanW family protein [Bacillota bacterium]